MEHFKELQQALSDKARIEEYLNRITTLGFLGPRYNRESVGITKHDNQRYNFEGIAKIIGEDRLRLVVEQFEGLLTVELHRAKTNAEEELKRYNITYTSPHDWQAPL